MKNNVIEVPYTLLSASELSADQLEDLKLAVSARQEAYAPISGFGVGAVIRTRDGRLHEGWNVENSVHAALHAEEGAIARIRKSSRIAGMERITVIGAKIEVPNSPTVVTPCGLCRQKLLELLISPDDNPEVIMAGLRGELVRAGLRDLMPLGFYPAHIR